jgi:hypothetical protein
LTLPKKIQSLLEMCLDPTCLNWHLLNFAFAKRRGRYGMVCLTPKHLIKANSSGWFEGNITKPIGYTVTDRVKNKINPDTMTILNAYKSIDKKNLLMFFPKEKHSWVLDSLKAKNKAFCRRMKSAAG